ncbi:MAG TPA: GGDEF domain-containing protein, partial [Pseudomonadales bacterium]|nr:GGDEF domain-containing protein [Pseudomonadales bacterium]
LRGSDAVGRIGGDEFVVLLSEIEDVHTALDVAVKISNAISAPVKLADLELLVSCSIGVAVYPDHGKDAPELFRHADLAMYRGKEGGRATIRLHGHNAGREPVTLRGISTAV